MLSPKRQFNPKSLLYPVSSFTNLESQPYRFWAGKRSDQKLLLQFLHQAYQEQWPTAELSHLNQMVQQLWSDPVGLWFIESTVPEHCGQALGCLWLGNAIDQVSGDRYTHIFLVYVNPEHRRRGLGTVLMKQAEAWAIQQGSGQIGLHVFVDNVPANNLYQRLGYASQAVFLRKPLSSTSQ
jgi:ribosomal protein S18 acetylase RimI-like enzyme